MPRGRKTQRISRRKTLAAFGTIGGLGLAGCTGNGNNNGSSEQDITITTAPSESGAHAAAQGLAAVVNENSDRVNITAQPNDGAKQGMALLDRDDVDIAMTDIRNANQIVTSSGQYEEDPLFQDSDLHRVYQYYTLQLGFKARSDSSIRTVNDFPGHRIGTGPAAGIVPENLLAALSYGVSQDEFESVNATFADEPSMLADEQVDVVTTLRLNATITPSYEQELNNVLDDDNQNFVIWPEEIVQQIQDDDSLVGQYYTEDEISDPVGWPDVEELWWMVSPSHLWTKAEMDSEILAHILQVMYDNANSLAEYHPIAANWVDTDFEFWLGNTPDWVTTHEGAMNFYETNNISE